MHHTSMDATVVSLLVTGSLLLGALAGWVAGVARGTARQSLHNVELSAQLAASEAAGHGLQTQLEHQRLLYRELADQARFEQSQREERERREQTVLRALAPVQQTLATMQEKVDGLERDRQEQFGSVAEQLRRARESDEALRATTESLAGALRSGATRGNWGETQLRRVVETAGLTHHVDFDLQTSIGSDAGAGRPDMVIRLPGDRAIAVDAKVPMDAFLEASAISEAASGDAAARRREHLRRHAKAVRAHVDALSKKAYWAGLETSPEFVICFVPSEALLSAALEEDPTLLNHAFGQRVALATPVNLWAVLKTIASTWTQQEVSAQARTLVKLGTQLFERIGVLAGHADQLRRAIERTVDGYNSLIGSLESRVLVTARQFPGIDATQLDAVDAPKPVETTPRRLTAPELLSRVVDDREIEQQDVSADAARRTRRDAAGPEGAAALGDLRERIT